MGRAPNFASIQRIESFVHLFQFNLAALEQLHLGLQFFLGDFGVRFDDSCFVCRHHWVDAFPSN